MTHIRPPHTCVAEFAFHGLFELCPKIQTSPCELAHVLEIHVAPQDQNPWRLPVSSDIEAQGVSARRAMHLLNRYLAVHNAPVGARHIRFSEFWGDAYEETCTTMQRLGFVVGLGYNLSRLVSGPPMVRHVSRIRSLGIMVELLDQDVGEILGKDRVWWVEIIPAVRDVDDGFWLLGNKDTLNQFGEQ